MSVYVDINLFSFKEITQKLCFINSNKYINILILFVNNKIFYCKHIGSKKIV